MDEYTPELLSLLDEDGNEIKFEVLDTLELDDNRYLALVPVIDDPQEMLDSDDQMVILKVITDDEAGEEYLEPIDNEEEFNKVAAIFMENLKDDFDFID
ncbi:MAG: DUF1292 domain-containing protein [Oscillospiraceae bacterium]|nr:DUF1292 domain-containing protein [Oscillospiraceae bacterium]